MLEKVVNIFSERKKDNFEDLCPLLADESGILTLTGHAFNVGKDFLHAAQLGKINKVTIKITYPKYTVKTKDKEYEKTALVTNEVEQVCAVGFHNN